MFRPRRIEPDASKILGSWRCCTLAEREDGQRPERYRFSSWRAFCGCCVRARTGGPRQGVTCWTRTRHCRVEEKLMEADDSSLRIDPNALHGENRHICAHHPHVTAGLV